MGGSKVRIRIRDEQPGIYFLELRNLFYWVKILKFFDEHPGSGMEKIRNRDPGWKKIGSGIRDKHPGSATLKKSTVWKRLDFPQGLAHGFYSQNPRFLFANRKNIEQKVFIFVFFFSSIF
jgi:hypothetical protein